jgi:ribulose-phosphate 3-epimerase
MTQLHTIIPAIIPQSREHLDASLRIVAPFTREVQVDIVDGIFVPFTSWPYVEGASVADIAEYTKEFVIEVDMMVAEPEKVLEQYLLAGVQKVVIHLESTEKLTEIIALKKQYDFTLGFSILNDTALDMLTSVIEHADYVQLMGIAHIGSQGQPFDTRVLARISTLKERYPQLLVSIDGSVNGETLPQLRDAGAERFATGSAIFAAENPEEAYRNLENLVR